MDVQRIQHDESSMRAASAYWQSVVLERAGFLLLLWVLSVRFIYWVMLYGFDTRMSTMSPRAEGPTWAWSSGVVLLVLALVYQIIARVHFRKSEVMDDQKILRFMPVFDLRKNPMRVTEDDGTVVDWRLR